MRVPGFLPFILCPSGGVLYQAGVFLAQVLVDYAFVGAVLVDQVETAIGRFGQNYRLLQLGQGTQHTQNLCRASAAFALCLLLRTVFSCRFCQAQTPPSLTLQATFTDEPTTTQLHFYRQGQA